MQGLRRLSAPSGTVRATVRASGHSPCVYCGVGVHSCMRAAVACESATWRLPFSRRWQSDSGLRPASVQPMPMDVHSYAPAFAFITTLCRHRADVSKVWKELTANLLPLERNPDALATVLDYLCTVANSPAAKSVAACNIAEYVCDCLVRWSPLCVATPQLATLMVDVTKAFLDAGQPSVAASLVESCPGKLASPQLYDVAVREVVKPHTALPTHWTAGAAAPVPSAVQSVAYASACIVAASTRGVLLSPDVLALFGRAGAVHNPQAVLDAWSAVNTLLQKSHSPRLSMLATTALLPYVYACNVALGKVRDSLRQLSWLQQLTTAMGSTALTSATVPVLDATGGAAPAARGSSGKPAPIVLPPVALMRVNRAALAAVVWACVMNDHPAPLLAYEFCKTSIASVKLVDEDAGMVFRLAEALLLSGKPAECVDVLTVVHERFPALLPRVLGGSMLVPVNWPLRARTADLKYVAATAEAESITLGDAVLRSLIRDVDAYVAAARRVGLDPSASLAFAVRNPARVPHTVRLATRCMAAGVHFSEATVQCIVQAAIDVDNMHLLEAFVVQLHRTARDATLKQLPEWLYLWCNKYLATFGKSHSRVSTLLGFIAGLQRDGFPVPASLLLMLLQHGLRLQRLDVAISSWNSLLLHPACNLDVAPVHFHRLVELCCSVPLETPADAEATTTALFQVCHSGMTQLGFALPPPLRRAALGVFTRAEAALGQWHVNNMLQRIGLLNDEKQ